MMQGTLLDPTKGSIVLEDLPCRHVVHGAAWQLFWHRPKRVLIMWSQYVRFFVYWSGMETHCSDYQVKFPLSIHPWFLERQTLLWQNFLLQTVNFLPTAYQSSTVVKCRAKIFWCFPSALLSNFRAHKICKKKKKKNMGECLLVLPTTTTATAN